MNPLYDFPKDEQPQYALPVEPPVVDTPFAPVTNEQGQPLKKVYITGKPEPKLVPVDHDPFAIGDYPIRPDNSKVETPKRKNWMMEPDLASQGMGELPEGVTMNDAGKPVWKDTGQELEVVRRPGILPFAKTPDGIEFAMPKLLDAAGSLMGGIVAPVKGVALGSGPIRKVVSEIETKFPEVKLDIAGGEGKPLVLSRIEVPKEQRNKGIGSEIMNTLTEAADKEGVAFALSPSADFGGNVNKLKDFYSKFGFKPNKGKDKDFSISESFIRNPSLSKSNVTGDAPKWQIKGFEDYNDWFHGTTHDFDKFSVAKGNPENYLGKYPHFTNSSKDASANYAGFGPDLTQRIELKAEEIFQKIADKKYGGEVGDDYGKVMTAAKNKAKEELAGTHEGAIIPANLKLENPISTVEHRPTWLDFSPKMDKEGEIIGDSPLAVKFYNSLQKQSKKYDFKPDEVMANLADHMYDEVKASTFDKALRNTEALTYAEDRKTGKLVSSDIIANIYKDMGFDGIVMDAKTAFPHMKDIPDGTLHAAPLKKNTVQSKITGKTLYNNVGSPFSFIPVDHDPFNEKSK